MSLPEHGSSMPFYMNKNITRIYFTVPLAIVFIFLVPIIYYFGTGYFNIFQTNDMMIPNPTYKVPPMSNNSNLLVIGQVSDTHIGIPGCNTTELLDQYYDYMTSYLKPRYLFHTGDITSSIGKTTLTRNTIWREWETYMKLIRKYHLDDYYWYADTEGNHDVVGLGHDWAQSPKRGFYDYSVIGKYMKGPGLMTYTKNNGNHSTSLNLISNATYALRVDDTLEILFSNTQMVKPALNIPWAYFGEARLYKQQELYDYIPDAPILFTAMHQCSSYIINNRYSNTTFLDVVFSKSPRYMFCGHIHPRGMYKRHTNGFVELQKSWIETTLARLIFIDDGNSVVHDFPVGQKDILTILLPLNAQTIVPTAVKELAQARSTNQIRWHYISSDPLPEFKAVIDGASYPLNPSCVDVTPKSGVNALPSDKQSSVKHYLCTSPANLFEKYSLGLHYIEIEAVGKTTESIPFSYNGRIANFGQRHHSSQLYFNLPDLIYFNTNVLNVVTVIAACCMLVEILYLWYIKIPRVCVYYHNFVFIYSLLGPIAFWPQDTEGPIGFFTTYGVFQKGTYTPDPFTFVTFIFFFVFHILPYDACSFYLMSKRKAERIVYLSIAVVVWLTGILASIICFGLLGHNFGYPFFSPVFLFFLLDAGYVWYTLKVFNERRYMRLS